MKRKKEKHVISVKMPCYLTKEQEKLINNAFGAKKVYWNLVLESYNKRYEHNKHVEKQEEKIPYNLINGKFPNVMPNTVLYGVNQMIDFGKTKLTDGIPNDYSWFKEYNSTIFESVIVDLGLAWDNYYSYLENVKIGIRKDKVNPPKFKRYYEINSITLRPTNTLTDGKNVIDWKHNLIKTPWFRKLGWIKCNLYRRFKGKIKEITISKDIDNKWYISLSIEQEGSFPNPSIEGINEDNTYGIDVGLKTFASLSNANENVEKRNKIKLNFNIKDKIIKLLKKKKKLQSQCTKCQVTMIRENCNSKTMTIREMNKAENKNKNAFKGWHKEYSKGYEYYRLKINKIEVKIRNIKKNFIENLAHDIIANENVKMICTEDLCIRDMMLRDKTKKEEGKKTNENKKIKRKDIARGLGNAALGKFIECLEWNSKKYGKVFLKIGRYDPSTKTCGNCGYINNDLDLDDRKWVCPKCGITNDRDLNAAYNIAKWGLEKLMEQITEEELELVASEAS